MVEQFKSGMWVMLRWGLALPSVVGLMLLLGIPLAGQYAQFPSTNNGRQVYPENNDPAGLDSNNPDKKRIKMLNAERQKALVSDTEKLLKLAKELNDEMAANESGTMSGAQLHKVEEIGKLAKSVKDKMSFSVGGYPSLTTQPPIQ